ncbi:response regulator [Litorivicinus lipolyticus]|uniref:Response regulator n=1 Tax=Litorivicinus lipolyticus TaxID=418701 RepID=A0A5Q2QD08_9GAMM|nr:sigma-54 dependent transcriptional regulator [Litorivicinus lipolyticus]QGG80231.1 response regulator [Litorivicinus lipolyticus]
MSRILLIEDDPALAEALSDILSIQGHRVDHCDTVSAGIAALGEADLVLSDINLGHGPDGFDVLRAAATAAPGTPVVLMTAYSDVRGAVNAIQLGARDYLAKPFKPSDLARIIERHTHASQSEPIAASEAAKQVLLLAKRIAASDATVMVSGASGTGKEVLARYVHQHSKRAGQPFVAINCAAIPDNLLEATLFGYEKGAFTGAVKRMAGKFEQACGGTLLLDEITEMDIALQSKLLRVLQEREVERLGSTQPIAVDVRIIATSNRVLADAVSDGVLREDLYYRLNVMPLAWPVLAERRGDIEPLAQHCLAKHAAQSGVPQPTLSAAAIRRLIAHDWPGNVRELDNVMHRALVLSVNGVVEAADLLMDSAPVTANESAPVELAQSNQLSEWHSLKAALIAENGRKERAAQRLGISPRTLRHKLAKYREQGMTL